MADAVGAIAAGALLHESKTASVRAATAPPRVPRLVMLCGLPEAPRVAPASEC